MNGAGPKMLVVDVRGAAEFKNSHIPGAINVPYDGIEKANLPREGAMVLYCSNTQCPWSKLAAGTLESAGYKNVWVLEGGISKWTAENYDLETPNGLQKKSGLAPVASVAPSKILKLITDKAIGVIDTRAENEFAIAHLPGAKNIPFEGLAAALAGLSKDTEWVVYDKAAENAKAAARQMMERGFKVKELSGGIQVWSAKEYPLETGTLK